MAPSDPEIYLQRGYCYQAAGNKDAASADFRRALALDRDLTAAREAIDSLQP
jgi:Flp pilus assembly protein TadD